MTLAKRTSQDRDLRFIDRAHEGDRGGFSLRTWFAATIVFWAFSFDAVSQDELQTVFLPAPRTMRQHLSRAEQAVKENRYGDVVAELGAILASPDPTQAAGHDAAAQDFFLGPANAAGTRLSIKTEAQRLLGTLPSRGRELYELQYGAEARALLDRAIQEGDFDKLTEVTRRFFHTKAGYEATLLLGRLHMDQGRPLAASLCFDRVWSSPEGGRFEPDLSVLLAVCYLHANQGEKARQRLTMLKRDRPGIEIQIGNKQVRSLPDPPDQLAWLEQHFGSDRGDTGLVEKQWTLYRGNASRNAASVGGVPLRQSRWQAPTPIDPADERLVADLKTGFLNEGRPLVPALHPLVVQDVILMRTPERLMALDFNNGKRVWEYPWWDLSYQSAPLIGRAGTSHMESGARRLQLAQRLWYDAPYGQVSSDGKSVFLIDELRLPSQSHVEWIPAPGGGRRRNPNLQLPHNQLVSLDLSRQGALQWMVGGNTGLDEPKLADAFFLGAPLPLFGQVFVLAEIRGEIRLVVLNARTGRQEWSQQLAHVDNVTIATDPSRRMAGASPSFADGVLICPTSAGAVVGVDIAMRSLLWGHQYAPATYKTRRTNVSSSYSAQASEPFTQWLDGTATIADGTVLLTPPGTNRLYCLDLITGENKWGPLTRQQDLAHMLFVACVHKGRVILVGQHHMVALRLQDGRLAWQKNVEFAHDELEVPSGRGFLSGKYYYLPTTASRLLKIDLEQGQIVGRSPTASVLGNLICYRDHVIAQGVDHVGAYYQVEPLRRQVAERLEVSTNDAWALARKGELCVNDGDLPGALTALRKAHQISPDDAEIRTLLVSTFLMALRDDFPAYRGFADEIEALIEQPSRQIEYLSRTGAGLQQHGESEAALATYLRLVDLINHESVGRGASQESPVALDEDWSARTDCWVSARLSELYASENESVRRQLDEAARQRLTSALRGPDEVLANFVRFFSFHILAERASLEWGSRLCSAGELIPAEMVLGQLEQSSDETLAASAVALLGELYREAQHHQLAAQCYLQLSERWSDVTCSDGRTGREVFESATQEGAMREALAAHAEWPYGEVEWEETNDGLPRQSHRRVYPVPMQHRWGVTSRVDQVTYDPGLSSAMIRDREGRIIARYRIAGGFSFYSHQMGMTRAAAFGNTLFLVLADQLAAINTLVNEDNEDDFVLWNTSLTQAVPGVSPQAAKSLPREAHNPLVPTAAPDYYLADQTGRPLGRTGVFTRSGICFQKMRTLVCVDPLTWKLKWSRNDVEQGADIFGDQEFVFVREPDSNEVCVLDARDGRLLERRSIPAIRRPWTIQGRSMLCWEKVDTGTRLYLHDVARSAEVWSDVFAKGSRGCLVGNDYVAVLRPDGRFVVRSLSDDHVLVDQNVQAEKQLGRIHAFVQQGQLFLLTSSDSSAHGTVNGGTPVLPITGRMYAFSESTGQALWQVPAFLDDFGFPLHQPSGSPVLWFVRQYSTRKTQLAPASSIRSAVACIDRRSGRLLFEVRDLQSQANFHDMLADREDETVRFVIPSYSFSLKWTGQPAPPAPTAQTGGAASTVEPEAGPLGRITNSLMNSLLRSEANEAPFDSELNEEPAKKPQEDPE